MIRLTIMLATTMLMVTSTSTRIGFRR